MDSAQKADSLNVEGNLVQDAFEALAEAHLAHGVKLPEMRVDWGPVEPRISLGSVSVADGLLLCRALGSEVR